MEPIDYRQVLRQRWRLSLVVAVVGALVGVLLPLHLPHPIPRTQYEASALVGVTPGGGPPTLGQIDFFAAQEQVIVDAAKSVGIKGSPAALEKDVIVTASSKKKKASPNGTISLSVKQPSAARSAKLTNAFVKTLGSYIQTQLDNDYQTKLQAQQQSVCNLQAQVNNLDSQIAQIVAPNAPGADSGGATTPNGITCDNSGAGNSTTSAYLPAAAGSTTAVLADSTAPATTGPMATDAAAQSTTTTTTTPSGPNTARTNPELADLQAQAQAVTQEYVAAVAKEQSLSDAGAQQSGFILVQAALPTQAKVIPGGLSILDHRSVRGGIGILGGGALGIGIGMLLAGLDKTLRTARRAEETFGLPVVAEIPASAAEPAPRRRRRRRAPAPPPVPVLTSPTSKQAEAYRMLRMALELTPGPAATASANGNGALSPAGAHGDGDHRAPAPATVATASSPAPAGADTPLWISEGAPPPRPPGPSRTQPMLLVVSAATEPSRALVVANLAATYAESGLSVYIVTTEDLRSRYSSAAPAGLFEPPSDITADEVLAQSNPTQITGVRRLGLDKLLDGPGQLAALAHDVLAVCRRMADVVIVDAPALLSTYDAETLVPEVDRVLVVAEAGRTTVGDAQQAGALFERIHAPVVGVVLTNLPPAREDVRAARRARSSRAGGTRSPRLTAPSPSSSLRRGRREKAARRVTEKRTSDPTRHRRAAIRGHRSARLPQRKRG